ncbi:MAG TPA: GLPGLI family protein [Chitinophagaceae bacterium]|nr:GLPGLI family protein [Chitinophagaceae bacterium]
MIRFLSIVILFVWCVTEKGFAQAGPTITYNNFTFYIFDSLGKPILPAGTNKFVTKLVINEHQSYYQTTQAGRNVYPLKKTLGKTFIPHTNYVNREKKILVSQFGDKYRVKEELKTFNWQMLEEKSNIAGYECKKAWSTYEGDSLVACFHEKLPHGFGPYHYTGLPGSILEVTVFRKDNIYRITAVTIENTTRPVEEPADGKLITWEQWKKIVAGRRTNNSNIRIVTF